MPEACAVLARDESVVSRSLPAGQMLPMQPDSPGQRRGQRWAARFDPDRAGGLRLTLAALAAFLLLIPFALGLVAVTDGWGPLHRLDVDVADRLNRQALAHPGLVTFLKQVSTICSPRSFEVVAVIVAVALWIRRSPRLAAWLALTVLLTDPLDTVLKDAVKRARPTFAHPVEVLTSYSFPSGHAFGSFVGVGALLLVGLPYVSRSWRGPLITVGVLVVLLVGYARVGLGVHYVSDVLGGWLLGAAWLSAMTAAFRAWRRDLQAPQRPLSQGLESGGPEPAVDHHAGRKA